jgi:CBS domain-containing protein
LQLARQWMDELKVHHLPVRERGKVVGILSDRDLALTLGSVHSGAKSPVPMIVEDAMLTAVYSVSQTTTVGQAAREMLEHRVGSVLVLGADDSLVGIFTDTDALKILAKGA